MRNTDFGEDAVDHFVQFDRALQVVSERLLDHHPAPPAALGIGDPDF